MGSLRLRISDGRDQDQLRGSVADVARVELEIGRRAEPSLLRLWNMAGALVALVALKPGGLVELKSAVLPEWPTAKDVVDRLALVIRTAASDESRAEFNNVDQISLRLPLTERDKWELMVLTSGNQSSAYTTQSVFSVFPPWIDHRPA